MDTVNIAISIYKQELADANEQKILLMTQCEIQKKEIEELRKQLEEKASEKNNQKGSDIMNINRDYLIINDVKKSNVTLGNGSMFFYITDKNTQNIFVNLVINVSKNDLI